MRLSDLLKLSAVDQSGNRLGSVKDVRLERRGSEWEVAALVIGHAAFADRLGFAYGDVEKPALLRLLVRWLTRSERVAPWAWVTLQEDALIVHGDTEDLNRVGGDGR